jgi:hypothetical protein
MERWSTCWDSSPGIAACSRNILRSHSHKNIFIYFYCKRSKKVSVYGLNYVIKKLESEDSLLIVDDVFDTGLSVNQVIKNLKKACKKNTPNIKIATPYYKPSNNKTEIEPDFYIHKSNKWLVFPHELEGLDLDEIKKK